MPGPDPATAAIRSAVRPIVAGRLPGDLVLVALSGGADSMALAAATAFEGASAGVRVGAVVVDHGLQDDSATVASRVGEWAGQLGLAPVEVVQVHVTATGTGLESAAREARHAALDAAADRCGAALVLLGHTLDDQAEQVLLGLARGSGARSLAGMPAARGRFARPLLGVSRQQTRQSCAAQNLPWWDDPMNEDSAYLRVRARRGVADLERDLGPGIAPALARSADQLREDADLLDALADQALEALLHPHSPAPSAPSASPPSTPPPPQSSEHESPVKPEVPGRVALTRLGGGVEVADLLALPRALRTRVWRRLLLAAGAPAGQLGARHTDACDALLTRWHGQGPLHLPGDLRVARADGLVTIRAAADDR